jgi:hypothetical protein
MTIGLPIFREAREQWLDRLLTQPWRTAPDGRAAAAAGGTGWPGPDKDAGSVAREDA